MTNSYTVDAGFVQEILMAVKEGMIRSQLQRHLDEIPMIANPHSAPSVMVENIVEEVRVALAEHGVDVSPYDVMLVWLTDLYFANMESN